MYILYDYKYNQGCKLSVLDTLTYLIRELDNGNKDYDGIVSRVFIPVTI